MSLLDGELVGLIEKLGVPIVSIILLLRLDGKIEKLLDAVKDLVATKKP